MAKKVLVISASLRQNSNSETLARQAAKGAQDAGHTVTFISLKDQTIGFCKGCLACQKTKRCVIQDDASAICAAVCDADVLIFANPIYYYELCGQLKTLLDRCNPLYVSDYRFRDVYLITTSAEDGDEVYRTAQSGLQGWIDCFEKAQLAGVLPCGGLGDAGEADANAAYLQAAYAFGKQV